jgi:glycosyltransferase involved in cell wall biosynthesis
VKSTAQEAFRQAAESVQQAVKPSTPFFTIGVTTYNRTDLLVQALQSIRQQTFADFEVIVGNDYTAQALSLDSLGIHDSRFVMVNHPRNLGEIGNMNALLSLSHGRYFTLLSDDDLYAPRFFEHMHRALVRFDFPVCALSGYTSIYGNESPVVSNDDNPVWRLLTGRAFLRSYLRGSLKVVGIYGFFEAGWLKSMGGIEKVADGPIAAQSEYMLVLRTGLLPSVAYTSSPLVVFRKHDQSYGCTFRDSFGEYWRCAIRSFVRGVPILRMPELRPDFWLNILPVFRLCFREFSHKVAIGMLMLVVPRRVVEAALLKHYQRNGRRQAGEPG